MVKIIAWAFRVLFLSFVSLLWGCGFHLRGQHILPAALHCIKLESATPYGDFDSTLRRMLIRIGANVKREGTAPIVLHIISTELTQDVPTIGGSNQARVYVYYYRVRFEVLDACHNSLIPPKCVSTSESLTVNAGTALESTNQLFILKQEMQIEAANMIINILNSPQMFKVTGSCY